MVGPIADLGIEKNAGSAVCGLKESLPNNTQAVSSIGTNNAEILRLMFLIVVPFVVQIIFPVLCGFLGEQPLSRPYWGIQWAKLRGLFQCS